MAKRVGANAELQKSQKSEKIASFKLGRWILIVVLVAVASKFGFDALKKIDIMSKVTPVIAVEKIEITGAKVLDSLSLAEAVGIDSGMTLFTADREAVEQRVMEYPGVASVKLGSRMSKKLKITITEREAVAMSVIDGSLYFMSSTGTLWPFTAGEYWDVPVLTGARDSIYDDGYRRVIERDLNRFIGIMRSFSVDQSHFPVAVNLENQDRISIRVTGFDAIVRFSNETTNRIENMRAIMEKLRRDDVEVRHYIDLSYKNVAFFR